MEQALRRLGSPDSITFQHTFDGSPFVIPQTIHYELDGKQRRWDVVSSHPSVSVLLYHRARRAFIIVRQFRPAVFAAAVRQSSCRLGLEHGFTFELCAGIVDKPGLSLADIALEEVAEETGYKLPSPACLRVITSVCSSVGISGSRQTLFAADVGDEMLGSGGGLAHDGEAIEVVALPVENVRAFVDDESLPKSAGLSFALLWGLDRLARSGDRSLLH